MIVDAVMKALRQMGDPAFSRVLGWTFALTLLLFAVLGIGMSELVARIPPTGSGWVDLLVDMAAGLGFLFTAWFLFPGAATAVMGLFLDDVAEAVEARHYPADPPGRPLGMVRALGESLRLGFVILVVNLAALPLYALGMVFPPLAIALYVGVNGYLLGREYFELVAMRQAPPAAGRALRKRRSGTVTLAGTVLALAFSLPVVNLLAPLFGTALMVHVFKSAERDSFGPPAGG